MTLTLHFANDGTPWANAEVVDLTLDQMAERFAGAGHHLQLSWPVVNGQGGHDYAMQFLGMLDLYSHLVGPRQACEHGHWEYSEVVTQRDTSPADVYQVENRVASFSLGIESNEEILDSGYAEVRCRLCGIDIRCTADVDSWEEG